MTANNITRKTFNKSFLKNVQSVFSYDTVSWTTELKEEITGYLVNKGFTSSDTGSNALVQCSNNNIVVMVSEKGVILSMEVGDYISFEHYVEIFSNIYGLFEIIGCSEIKNFIFQKLNLYRIGMLKDGQKPTKDYTYRALFSNVVRENLPAFTDTTDPGYFYTIQPGFNENEDYVVARLLISSMRVSPVKLKDLVKELTHANEKMYRLWYDATSDRVKDLMSK